ncbi:MAG: GntR family transcriptional regulator [Actinomycetia bacterium]|nr:GntR family transcriptional regulator [Actinomycetes bacterium]
MDLSVAVPTPSLHVSGPTPPGSSTTIFLTQDKPLTPETALTDRRALVLLSIRDVMRITPLAQEIFDELTIEIVEGRLRPGDTLDSVTLARRFGTSRTPVREALRGLERQGVVVVPARRRPYVAELTLRKIENITVLWAALAGLVAELVVERAEASQLAELWRWYGALEDDVARGSPDDFFWHNVGFRAVEARVAGNEDLLRAIESLGLRALQLRHRSLSQVARIATSLQGHRRLLDAYRDRDATEAPRYSRELILAGLHEIERSLVSDVVAEPLRAGVAEG